MENALWIGAALPAFVALTGGVGKTFAAKEKPAAAFRARVVCRGWA